jgi:hypothetical protein
MYAAPRAILLMSVLGTPFCCRRCRHRFSSTRGRARPSFRCPRAVLQGIVHVISHLCRFLQPLAGEKGAVYLCKSAPLTSLTEDRRRRYNNVGQTLHYLLLIAFAVARIVPPPATANLHPTCDTHRLSNRCTRSPFVSRTPMCVPPAMTCGCPMREDILMV